MHARASLAIMKPMSPSDVDEQIARYLEAGDPRAAATRLIEAYGPGVLGYLRVALRDRDAADEAFAQCCEDIWKGMGTFRGESSFRTWAYRIGWHAALRQLRDGYRRRRCVLTSSARDGLVHSERTPTPLHRCSAARDRLARLRSEMSPDEQALLTLRLDRGLSWSEVAHVLSTDDAPATEATVRKRYERLCAKLRRLLAQDRGAAR
jgi:RNA polymerase sigma-70 factor, ECF subfamily